MDMDLSSHRETQKFELDIGWGCELTLEQTKRKLGAQDCFDRFIDWLNAHTSIADLIRQRLERVRATTHFTGVVLDNSPRRAGAVAARAVQRDEQVDRAGIRGREVLVTPLIAKDVAHDMAVRNRRHAVVRGVGSHDG
jgi:hypothetical protein